MTDILSTSYINIIARLSERLMKENKICKQNFCMTEIILRSTM